MLVLADQPNPLQIPEVIIVISVLVLWFGSIIIFIRHSQLLRIRHRDVPTRSIIEPAINLNHRISAHRASDVPTHSKSPMSSIGIVTPELSNNKLNIFKYTEKLDTVSLSLPPLSRKRRNTRSFDLNALLLTKSFDKTDDKELLLRPYLVPPEVKRSLLDLYRTSVDNIHRKSSSSDLSLTNPTTSYSASDMSKPKGFFNNYLRVKKKTTQDVAV